ncbi:MAG: hypothetical protein KDH20_06030 [Rhodocyclaceae bacterium]|nr:hypothetical protein [Rhodocyclaceae bacterium]
MKKPSINPYEETARLIGSAITNARVFGENRRIANLVASSVGRFAAQIDDDGGDGDELVDFAIDQLTEDGGDSTPALGDAIRALATARAAG